MYFIRQVFFADYEVNLYEEYIATKSYYHFMKELQIIAGVLKIEVRLERVWKKIFCKTCIMIFQTYFRVKIKKRKGELT